MPYLNTSKGCSFSESHVLVLGNCSDNRSENKALALLVSAHRQKAEVKLLPLSLFSVSSRGTTGLRELDGFLI